MKYLTFLLVMLLAGTCYAGTVYKKVSDTVVKRTETKQVVNEETLTLSNLRAQKRQLMQNKANYDASIDAQVTALDKDIAEVVKLGIKEIDDSGNILP